MLQQILKDMWIDPELLAELGEEQRQTLFCKMREEQVRRWKAWDQRQSFSQNERKSKVKFLLGDDGEPWTWVMGEHPLDKTVEQIIEEEAREKARKIAEKETQELRKSVEAELSEILDMNQKQIERLEAAQELNRLKAKTSPTVIRKIERPEIFSMNGYGKKKESERMGVLEKISNGHQFKVAAAVAQWEKKVMEERTCVIFNRLQRIQMEVAKEAEDIEEREEKHWREQEQKAKEAEMQIREIARRAREEHRRNSHCEPEIVESPDFCLSSSPSSKQIELLATIEASRPPNRTAIIDWFRGSELERKAAVDENGLPEPWFHGLISRQEAEELLVDKPVGTFLVRLSERIWGYAITYRDVDRCKHYLIDASSGHYQFLGTDQMPHNSLGALVRHHQQNHITIAGKELLLKPCPTNYVPAIFRTPSPSP